MRKITEHIRPLWVACLLTWLAVSLAAAADAPRIVVLNSDVSVQKYRTVQESFVQSLTIPARIVNLADPKQIESASALLSKEKTDLIYCIGSKAYQAGYHLNTGIPLVFSSIINWQRLPIREGTCGVSNELHPVMQMMLFRYIFPKTEKIGVIFSEQFNTEWFSLAAAEAENVGIQLIGRKLTGNDNTLAELAAMLPRMDAYWLISDPIVIPNQEKLMKILKLCDEKRVPVFTYNDIFVKYGATLSVSVDDPTVGRQAAQITETISAGKALTEKVLYPAGSRMELNMRMVRRYGLSYSCDALGNINKIIE